MLVKLVRSFKMNSLATMMWLVLSVSLLLSNGNGVANSEDTLEVVHVIFRHGEKNPDTKFTYPKDPYKNATFKVFPQGQLTKIGRNTMYDLGHTLRKRYNNFLGKIYSENVVEAWASPFPRTVLSLQLVLASLFVPSEEERWHKDLNWQPTLYHSVRWDDDRLFLNFRDSEYMEEYNAACKSDAVRSMMKKYENITRILEENTGYVFRCFRQAYATYLILEVEEEANWKLPAWTREVYPEPLREFSLGEYKMQTFNNRLRRLLMGNLFIKMLSDTENRIKGNSPKKFHLYAAHENIVYHTLSLLGFAPTKLDFPHYGACLIIEVHKIKKRRILKVFYRQNKHTALEMVRNHQGRYNITYKEFEKIVRLLFDTNSSIRKCVSSGAWMMYTILVCNYFFKSV